MVLHSENCFIYKATGSATARGRNSPRKVKYPIVPLKLSRFKKEGPLKLQEIF